MLIFIFFSSAFMQAKDLCHYKENKSRYSLAKKQKGFKEGLDAIEMNFSIKFGGKKKKDEKSDDIKSKAKKVVGC